MSAAPFNKDARALVGYLGSLSADAATRLVCLLAIGAIKVIREDYSLWPHAEEAVFNGAVLLFCMDTLANEDLAEMINYGIQIDDLREFIGDPLCFASKTNDVEARAMQLFAKNASHSC